MAASSTLRSDRTKRMLMMYAQLALSLAQNPRLALQLIRSQYRYSSGRIKAVILLLALLTAGSVTFGITELQKRRKRDAKERRELHRQSSSVLLSDGWSREIFVPTANKPLTSKSKSSTVESGEVSGDATARVVIKPTKKVTFEAHRRLFLQSGSGGKSGNGSVAEKKAGVNRQFLKEFSAIWSIIVPRLQSKTSALLFIHALFLASRTYLSLLVAKLDGQIVRDLIAANGKDFLRGLGYWFLLAIPASYTNAMIRFLQAKISIAFRTKLIRYIHDIYLSKELGYYKVTNIDGGIEGADQYITADVTRFCDSAASLYSNLGKPFADFIIFSYQLQRNLGPLALIGIFSNYALTAWLLKSVAPPFGRLAAAEARLEGDYRNAHTKLITNAEEIAFYDGTGFERAILDKTYKRVIVHISKILKIKVSYNMFEDFILKYSWSALGYMFASLPVFLPTWSGNDGISELATTTPSISLAKRDFRERDRMKQFITNKRLMLSLADAGGRMMYSIKDLAELAGYTSRVFQLLSTLHRVHANSYGHELAPNEVAEPFTLADVHGTVQQGFEGVRFEHTPIVIPGLARTGQPGEVLIKDLNIRINPGDHILISGANGVGKSSIARVLAGLWPVYRGLVSKPLPKDITFLPQRPYLSHGTLRDQIIYPDSHADMLEAGGTDAKLMEILKLVRLEYIPGREGGWETRKQWKDVFSGGEKQRVMFARILYKNPKFAVIDEGTSAVSADVEGLLYEICKKQSITLVTISHRPSLLKYHTAQLRVGLGANGDEWSLERSGTAEARLTVDKEIEDLKAKLSQVDAWKARRQQIVDELSGKTAA
ncbi:ATP-binding cassette long-chain fatty acid transporter PXA1 [Sugiyamaella lignohabitans]|uniref:ATP-binding cassette long-chain fatty acid transporter PXA1 n=1 Tax=Sugiyamaella lignohabitans TaxID=796027 RepID=A0A167EAP6_9ASCO|nr:ATP-binding cassette long-chain fatty acid transporter PXA1 [Sugiyamaella lignohabitans]ANB13843.1 ATP-binding cassette long-chain fatty acid transporter PXA1 [Sugiyamaella lignohabitans]